MNTDLCVNCKSRCVQKRIQRLFSYRSCPYRLRIHCRIRSVLFLLRSDKNAKRLFVDLAFHQGNRLKKYPQTPKSPPAVGVAALGNQSNDLVSARTGRQPLKAFPNGESGPKGRMRFAPGACKGPGHDLLNIRPAGSGRFREKRKSFMRDLSVLS